jgi:hypothetical protein
MATLPKVLINGRYQIGRVLHFVSELRVNATEVVTVSGGTPTLTLNDGGTAIYTGGSGTNALTFSYTVATGQNTSDLAVTTFNLKGAIIADDVGNAANLSSALTNPAGTLQIDTTSPAPPLIMTDTANQNNTLTLTGTAEAGSTVNVYEKRTALGHTQANASGAWSFTTAALRKGFHTFTATATDAAGNVSALSNSIDPAVGHTAHIGSGSVAFAGSTGTLKLNQSSAPGAKASNFGGQNPIDLPTIGFDAQTTLGYSSNSSNAGGTMSLAGGVHSAQVALLGSYMASSFVMESDHHCGTIVLADATQSGTQSLLANPHH